MSILEGVIAYCSIAIWLQIGMIVVLLPVWPGPRQWILCVSLSSLVKKGLIVPNSQTGNEPLKDDLDKMFKTVTLGI